jgi:hypothetical protein
MNGGLREALDLPESDNAGRVTGNEQFSQDFRAGLASVNQDLQVVAIRGDQAEYLKLDANRQTLIKAYQATSGLGDAAKSGQVMGAVTKIKQQTAAKATAINAGYEEWQKRADAFDAAVVKIGQLEDAGHPSAPVFRKLSDAIQSRANNRDYSQANTVFDQLQPKLDKVMAQPLRAGNGGAPGGEGNGSGAPGGGGGATGATGAGAHTGGGSGGGTSGPTGKPAIFAVDPDRVVKLNKLNTTVFATVSSQSHADAWRMHGMDTPAPVAYQVDKLIYVDDSRWPPNTEKPTYTAHPSGGPKINPPANHKPSAIQFPNNPNHTLVGTTPDIGGGAGKGLGGTETVSDDKIAATHQKAPDKTTHTYSTAAHNEIWAQLGNKPPAPIAFMQDGYMRVDVERYALQKGQWSGERLNQIGLKPIEDARAEATKLRGAIESQRKKSVDQLERMRKIEPELKKQVDAATGDKKKELADKQAQLSKAIGVAERAVAQAHADLETIDNPGSKREQLLAILARQKTAGSVSEATEITSTGLDPYKKGKINKDVTATTTSYADGQAKTESVRSQQKVGLDGYTHTESHDKTVTDGQTTARSSDEKKVNVSLTGKVTAEEKQSIEVEKADGSKAALETKKNKEISSKGASQTKTATVTKVDGSSVSNTTKQGVERGDGKIVGTAGTSVTKTNTSGTVNTTDKNVSGGMVAGKDGMGFKGGVDGGKSVTSKKGRQVGANLSLHANVTCKIGEPKGEPKLYPVTVTVSFVASGSVSGGAGKKEGSKVSGSIEAKKSLEGSMSVTHNLGEAELGAYTKALEAASKGSKVAATQQELAIIATGVNQGWDIARQMWESGGGKLSKQSIDGLKKTGDSVQVSESNTEGLSAKAKVHWVGGGYGETHTDATTRTATRNNTGGVDLNSKHEKGTQTDVSGSLDVGVVGLEVGKTQIHKTRFGYSIAIDPKNDPDGKILDHLNHCKTEQDYQVFVAVYTGKVTLIGKMQGQTDAEGTNIGVTIGGKSLKLGTDQSVDKEVKTDAKGNIVSKATTGEAGAGGGLGSLADSKRDQAMAESDAEGNASLTLTSTTKQNYGSRVRDKERKKLEDKQKGTGKATGVLTDAAGGEEDDTAIQDVSGLKLANKDLQRIGKVAVNSMPAWMGMTRRWQEKEDWKKAGLAIRKAKGAPSAVAHELAEFIGGDRVERLETVRLMVRGGYHSTIGKAFEFPDSLRDIRADYDLVTDPGLTKKLYALEKKEGTAAVTKEGVRLLGIVDRIMPRVQACKDFDNLATKTEMLSELNLCRTMLNQGNQRGAGNLKPEDDPKVLAEEGDRLMKLCNAYGVEQEKLIRQLNNLPDRDESNSSDRKKGRGLIKQLEDLHHRWWSEFYRLKDNYSKRKLVLVDPPFVLGVPQHHPTESLVANYEKKFG